MIAEIQAIACLLASEPLTVDEVVTFVGTVTKDYGSNVLVKPYYPEFEQANIIRDIDSITFQPINNPIDIDLVPVEPPKVETLAQAFGKYERTHRIHYTSPRRILFYLDMPGRPYTITLIADLKNDRVINIALRRDRRL